jgi:N-acetyl-1-D-myo-inositol-2-amino-2-deoxy-alpha-D-glucopyranoside deacetylase
MSTPESEPKTLLAVLAHPDDESFGMGGTLAMYARQGVNVHLVCATRGEAGNVSPEFLQGFESVAELREHELRCAAGKLGLAGVHFLDYRDSGMPGSADNAHPQALIQAPMEEIAGKIVGIMRQLRPQVVVTFDPIGGYRHPDHIAIHKATVAAFHAAGNVEWFMDQGDVYQPEKLYYHTIPRRMLKWAVRLIPLFGKDPRRWGQNGDIDLYSIAKEEFPVHARIKYRPVKFMKESASACHASQGGMLPSRGLMRWLIGLNSGVDEFMRAYPQTENGVVERDLFEGVGEKA